MTTAPVTRYSDPFLCPDCGSRLPVQVRSCPGCGLTLDHPLAGELLQTLRTADDLLTRLRALSSTAPAPAPLPAYPAARPGPHQGRPARLSAVSVPKILLGLGALCLLVAAVIFLAVAWSWLGVGGRTSVLVALTLASVGLELWLERRDLRVAAEALTTVGLGLLALDVVGADNAGWLGALDGAGLTCAVGGSVLVAALALALVSRLGAPQVLAVLALSVTGAGAVVASGHVTTVLTVTIAAHLVLGAAGWDRALAPVRALVGLAAATWWLLLVTVGVVDAADHPSLHGLWAEGYGAALLLASLLLLAPVPLLRSHPVATRALTAGGAAMVTLTGCAPVLDESVTAVGSAGIVVLVAWTAASLALPAGWRVVARAPMLLATLPVATITAALAAQAAGNVAGRDEPFTRAATMRLGDPDLVATPVLLVLGAAALVLAAVSLHPRPSTVRPQVPAAVLLAASVATLALFPVPAAALASALVALGAGLLAEAWRHEDPVGRVQALTGLGVAALAAPVALPSDVLTASVAAALAALAAIATARGRTVDLRAAGGLLLPASLAGLVWSAASAAGVEQVDRGVPVLLVVGLLAVAVPRVELEVAAALAGLAGALGALAGADDTSVALAVHLTVAGVLVCASAIVHPERRALGWAGGLLLAAATWVRLADLGVSAPEAYTLPSAVALLLVGLHRLTRDPEATTVSMLLPGLTLATVPSLLWVLTDPLTWRAVLLGAGCLLLVLGGTRLRWNAPLVVGASVGALVVLRELAPYAAQTPQWVLIGVAGTLLTVVGITWERRLHDLHTASGYLAHLR